MQSINIYKMVFKRKVKEFEQQQIKDTKGQNIHGDDVKMEFFNMSQEIDLEREKKEAKPKSAMYHYAHFKR